MTAYPPSPPVPAAGDDMERAFEAFTAVLPCGYTRVGTESLLIATHGQYIELAPALRAMIAASPPAPVPAEGLVERLNNHAEWFKRRGGFADVAEQIRQAIAAIAALQARADELEQRNEKNFNERCAEHAQRMLQEARAEAAEQSAEGLAREVHRLTLKERQAEAIIKAQNPSVAALAAAEARAARMAGALEEETEACAKIAEAKAAELVEFETRNGFTWKTASPILHHFQCEEVAAAIRARAALRESGTPGETK